MKTYQNVEISETFMKLFFSASEQFAGKADGAALQHANMRHAIGRRTAVTILWRSFFKRSRLLKHEQLAGGERRREGQRASQERRLCKRPISVQSVGICLGIKPNHMDYMRLSTENCLGVL